MAIYSGKGTRSRGRAARRIKAHEITDSGAPIGQERCAPDQAVVGDPRTVRLILFPTDRRASESLMEVAAAAVTSEVSGPRCPRSMDGRCRARSWPFGVCCVGSDDRGWPSERAAGHVMFTSKSPNDCLVSGSCSTSERSCASGSEIFVRRHR